MTVKELKEHLENFDNESPIMIKSLYDDSDDWNHKLNSDDVFKLESDEGESFVAIVYNN